jgi:methylated-DNA-[protein]-cysteine S-methyltransferase
MTFKFTPTRSTLQTPLGSMTLAAHHDALVGVWFDGQQHQPDPNEWHTDANHPVLQRAATQLLDYFAGRRSTFELPLDLGSGTEFQQRVWQGLLQIPPGSTWSYGMMSTHLGAPKAVRAVAAAIGRNPISIVVPCHRVIGAHGALTGYAGGLPRKAALLQLESRV